MFAEWVTAVNRVKTVNNGLWTIKRKNKKTKREANFIFRYWPFPNLKHQFQYVTLFGYASWKKHPWRFNEKHLYPRFRSGILRVPGFCFSFSCSYSDPPHFSRWTRIRQERDRHTRWYHRYIIAGFQVCGGKNPREVFGGTGFDLGNHGVCFHFSCADCIPSFFAFFYREISSGLGVCVYGHGYYRLYHQDYACAA